MDFLLAVGWIVASLVFGYLVTRSIMDHIRTHRKISLEIDELRLSLAAHHEWIFTGPEGSDPPGEDLDVEGEILEELEPDPEPEDDLPF